MGQEIRSTRFDDQDFQQFGTYLQAETALLAEWCEQGKVADRGLMAGFELEAWLVDENYQPAGINQAFLEAMDDPLATGELALFNLELNNHPRELTQGVFGLLEQELMAIWSKACATAQGLDARLLTIGILPTLRAAHLDLDRMSPLKRYQALNEQVLRARDYRPLRLDIIGNQHLEGEHHNVMLEAATTSFQIHLKSPIQDAHRFYNAAIAASAPLVAACANSPYLFGLNLWRETRIPLFEQSVDIGGFGDVAGGPLRRVSFGSGYVRNSILECFKENQRHYPILLPMTFDRPIQELNHLRLHNGTIWRWNRPLVGFDNDGTPHIRIEHRILPGSTSIADAIANAAFFYGLAQSLREEAPDLNERLPFAQAKDNFYQAARYGLSAHIKWLDGQQRGIRDVLLDTLLPRAKHGLDALGIERNDRDHYLGIIEQRVERRQTGADWQCRYAHAHGGDMQTLTAAYCEYQRSNIPVHDWPL